MSFQIHTVSIDRITIAAWVCPDGCYVLPQGKKLGEFPSSVVFSDRTYYRIKDNFRTDVNGYVAYVDYIQDKKSAEAGHTTGMFKVR